MKGKLFNLKDLPDLHDNYNDTLVRNNLIEIYDNYKYLIKDTIKTIEFCLSHGINKPLTLFYLFFCIELFLKFYLIKNTSYSLKEIAHKGHSFQSLFNEINCIDKSNNMEELEFLIRGFKDKHNNNIDINQYANFKYNHLKKEEKIIFDYEIKQREKKKIEEVMKWIKNYLVLI